MKQSFSRSRWFKLSGFTLIELLVVIAIIAILAAVLLSAGSMAIKAAQRAKAANLANQIQTACMGYYTEYSVYPVVVASPPVDILYSSKTDWQPMSVCLCGGIDPGNPGGGQYSTQTIPNTRQIAFLTLNASDLDTSITPAVPKLPFTINGSTAYFQMAIDADYSGILGDSTAGATPPDFSSMAATLTAYTPPTAFATTKKLAVGVAVWGNCDPQSTATKTHPNFWVHTY